VKLVVLAGVTVIGLVVLEELVHVNVLPDPDTVAVN
jgi:hypothetical protein